MDTLTHSLLGATSALALAPALEAPPRFTAKRIALVGALAGAFPDIDYLTFWINPLLFLSDWHRGPTHSLVMLPIWAACLGWTLRLAMSPRPDWWRLSLVCAVGLLSHLASDVITVYGTQLGWPVADTRYALGTTFVIDPWLTSLVIVALLAATRCPAHWAARAGLLFLVLYVTWQSALRDEAENTVRAQLSSGARESVSVHAIPQPFAPWNWKVIADHGEWYDVAHFSIRHWQWLETFFAYFPFSGLTGAYRPPDQAVWVRYPRFGWSGGDVSLARAAWKAEELEPFRRFTVFPVVFRIDRDGAAVCVWFTDLRYVLPELTPPFRYGVCRDDAAHPWTLYRLKRFTDNDRMSLD